MKKMMNFVLVTILMLFMGALLILQPVSADTATPNGTTLIGHNQWKTLINVTNTDEGTPINDFHVAIIGATITGKSSFPPGWKELGNTTNSVTWQIDRMYPINGDYRIKKDDTGVFDITTDSPFFEVRWVTTHKSHVNDSGNFTVP